MPRIICRTPSTGKPLRISFKDVTVAPVSIAEAPDFSVPDASEKFSERDPADASRAIRPGEIFFLTPMSVKNKGVITATLEIYLQTEDGVIIELGKITVPAGDTGFVPLQGRSLFKRTAINTTGDALYVKASDASIFDVWCAAEEKLSSEHSGVGEI